MQPNLNMFGLSTFLKLATAAGIELPPTATAFENIPANSMVYIRTDGTLALANAGAQGKEAIGFTRAAYPKGKVATYHTISGNRMSGMSGLVPRREYYLSVVPGQITDVAPTESGQVILKVGQALSRTEFLFMHSMPITI